MAAATLLPFDMHALCDTLDGERRSRNLSWQEMTDAINAPFAHVQSIPIHVSTLRGMRGKRSVTSAVVLQSLRWMRTPPEAFLKGRNGAFEPHERLPDIAPTRILRFDTKRLYEAIDADRRRRSVTWKQVANELPGFTESMLRNLRTSPLIGFPRVMWITQWLGRPAAVFMCGTRH
jgi:hypothetical protein